MSMKDSDFGPRKYERPGRTKQSFKDSCDVNKILTKMQKAGTLSHLEQHGAEYGDFSDFDFQTAMNRLARGKTLFERLPAEVKREFNQDPGKFFEFVNRPENIGRLQKVLPKLAEPGRQNTVNPRVDPAPGEGAVTAEPSGEEPAAGTAAVEPGSPPPAPGGP